MFAYINGSYIYFVCHIFRDVDVMSYALYPKVFSDFETMRAEYGPMDKLPTKAFLQGLEPAEQVKKATKLLFFF